MALQNLRSNTANKRPTASGMVDGQVAINTNATNPGLFFKDAGDGIRKVGPVFIGSSAPNSSPATGGSTGHSIGEQWLDTSGSRYVVKTWDGTAWRDDDSNYLQLTGGALSGALTIDNAANVAALDLKFDGDTDTGFYAPAANTLGFVGGGTERVRIDSSGRVGIGTTAPSSDLDVLNTGFVNLKVRSLGTNTAALNLINSTRNYSINSSGGALTFYDATAGSERARIDSSGKVGIGTTSPTGALDVKQTDTSNSLTVVAKGGTNGGGYFWETNGGTTYGAIGYGNLITANSGSANSAITTWGSQDLLLGTNRTERLRIDSSGKVGIGTTSPTDKLNISSSTNQIGLDTGNQSTYGTLDVGHFTNGAFIGTQAGSNTQSNVLRFGTGGSERMRIDSSGRVGIGTSSPGNTLHLKGAQGVGIRFENSTSTNSSYLTIESGDKYQFNAGGSGYYTWVTGGSEKMRIDSSGRILIGTTTEGEGGADNLTIADSGNCGITLRSGTSSQCNIFFSDGTSGTPEYDGYIAYNQNNRDLKIGTASSTRLTIDSSGRVGITTQSMSSFAGEADDLVVGAGAGSQGITVQSSTSGSGNLYFADGTSGNARYRGYVAYSHNVDAMDIGAAGNLALRIDSSGNVGIGTTSPTGYIHIEGASTGTETYGRFTTGPANGDQSLVIKSGSNRDHMALQVSTNAGANDDLSLQPDGGNVGIGTTSPSSYGGAVKLAAVSTGNTALSIASGTSGDGNLFFADGTSGDATYRGNVKYSHSSDAMQFSTAASERMRIDSSGNVGIGTSSPGYKLDVNGTANFGQITVNDVVASSSNDTFPVFRGLNAAGTATNFRVNGDGSAFFLSNVGIGVTSPSGKLNIQGSDSQLLNLVQTSGDLAIRLNDSGVGSAYIKVRDNTGGSLSFDTGGSERVRIDSSGRLLVGTSSEIVSGSASSSLHMVDGGGGKIYMMRDDSGSTVAGNDLGMIRFYSNDGTAQESARIEAEADLDHGTDDKPGRLVFSTTADGASSPTEHVRINSKGALKASTTGNYDSANDSFHEFINDSAITHVVRIDAANSSYAQAGGGIFMIDCNRGHSSGWTFGGWYSGGVSDREFNFRGDGNGFADGSWTGGGADYAEYFEWSDGNTGAEDRRGISVVLDGNNIREAVAGEEPIGVISGNPSVVGDAAWNNWSEKYLRDDYGSYVLDANGDRQLNPDFNPDIEYVSREDRPEWGCVGLMGKLRIRKGQVTGTRWIKMRDVSDTVEEWLVR